MTLAAIEFADPRFERRFTTFPMPRPFLESDVASRVLGGTPFAAAVLCRRYWRHNLKTVRRLGIRRGGMFAGGIHFRYQGGQIRSLLSLLSYLGSGDYRAVISG